jgi:hypothetical protein
MIVIMFIIQPLFKGGMYWMQSMGSRFLRFFPNKGERAGDMPFGQLAISPITKDL